MFTDKAGLKRGGNGKGKSPLWVRGLESTTSHYDDRALAVFHTDSLIPEQFHNTYKSRACLAPEKSLMLAVLHDAVVCFQDNVRARDKRRRRLFLEAEEWILSEDSRYLFSFGNVCASLGFDAGYLRHGLLHWKAGTLATSMAKPVSSKGRHFMQPRNSARSRKDLPAIVRETRNTVPLGRPPRPAPPSIRILS
jgi:hypothetical protein